MSDAKRADELLAEALGAAAVLITRLQALVEFNAAQQDDRVKSRSRHRVGRPREWLSVNDAFLCPDEWAAGTQREG